MTSLQPVLSSKSTHMDNVPKDILLHIATFCSESDLAILARTCKRLRDVCTSNQVWSLRYDKQYEDLEWDVPYVTGALLL